MRKALQDHKEAIASGEVTGTNVRGIRKAINLAERGLAGWSVPSYAGAGWRTDVFELESFLEDRLLAPIVRGDLHESGVKVLRNKRYAKRWTPNQQAIIDELDHFKLIRFDRIGRRGEYSVPVFRAIGFSGLGFNFRNIPWQSGGDGPEAVE